MKLKNAHVPFRFGRVLTLLLFAAGAVNSTAQGAGFTLDKRTLSLNLGETDSLAAAYTFNGETTTDLVWSSSDPDVATVDDSGKVSALSVGFAVITAGRESDGLSGICSVLINAKTDPNHYSEFVYKDDLVVRVYYPSGWKASDQRPAAVFFHGGSWNSGSYYQNMPHAQYLASRGFVAMTAQYRLDSVSHTIVDARSCLRWAKGEAANLGIDPERVVAGGSSAGGHLALCCYTGEGIDDPRDDLGISARPELLLLFDGAFYLNASQYLNVKTAFDEAIAKGSQPTREDVFNLDAPPAIMFYGTADFRRYEGHHVDDVYHGFGIDAEYWLAEGESHGFSDQTEDWRNESFYLMDRFLSKHGYLSGEPGKVLSTDGPRMEPIVLGGEKRWLVTPQAVVSVSSGIYPAERTIDGLGFDDPRVLQNSSHGNRAADMWQTGPHAEAEIVYDLGDPINLRAVHLWNHSVGQGATGPDSIEVWVSTSDDPNAEFVLKTVLRPLRGGAFAQNFKLTADSVRFVKLRVSRAYPPVGFAEIRFSTTCFPPRLRRLESDENGSVGVTFEFDGATSQLKVESSEDITEWAREHVTIHEVEPGVFETELYPKNETSVFYRILGDVSE